MFTSIAVLTSVCGMADCSLLPGQAQPAMDTSIASFQAYAITPSMLIQTKANEQRVALSFNEDFSPSSSFVLLKDRPQVDGSSSLPDIHAGYGQFFSIENHVRPSEIEAPSRLYLKVSFTF